MLKRNILVCLSAVALCACKTHEEVQVDEGTKLVIRKMDYPITKRPNESTERTALLLEVWPGGGETAATPYLELDWNGEPTICAFNVLKVFESDSDAFAYAIEQGIEDIDLGD